MCTQSRTFLSCKCVASHCLHVRDLGTLTLLTCFTGVDHSASIDIKLVSEQCMRGCPCPAGIHGLHRLLDWHRSQPHQQRAGHEGLCPPCVAAWGVLRRRGVWFVRHFLMYLQL